MTPTEALKQFGTPGKNEAAYMMVWAVPADIQKAFVHVKFSALGTIGFPKKIYINKHLQPLLEMALRNLMSKGLQIEMKTWDGCYIIRNARGLNSWSMHAWGLAIDVNAATNQLGKQPTLSPNFVKSFTDAGLTWGGVWKRPDGMHFQL
jgi:D-alanyl-D-alanine carboxypeptidase